MIWDFFLSNFDLFDRYRKYLYFQYIENFFFQVHKKTKGKPAIAEKISKQLSTACSEVDAKLGLSPVQYDDLPRASLILRKNLLENVHLNNDFYLQLAGQLNDPPEQESNYRKQLQAFSKLKATLQILQLIQKRFEEKMEKMESNNTEEEEECRKDKNKFVSKTNNDKKCCTNRGKGQIKANATLLRKCLLNVIGAGIVNSSSLFSLHFVERKERDSKILVMVLMRVMLRMEKNSKIQNVWWWRNADIMFILVSDFLDYSSFERKKQQLHTKLSGMIKHDCGLDVLILALISTEEDGSENVSRYIIDFIEGAAPYSMLFIWIFPAARFILIIQAQTLEL